MSAITNRMSQQEIFFVITLFATQRGGNTEVISSPGYFNSLFLQSADQTLRVFLFPEGVVTTC